MSAWREALREMRLSLVAGVWVGAVVLAVLSVLWLQVPDSHVWQFVFSIVFACGLLALLFFLVLLLGVQKDDELGRSGAVVVTLGVAGWGDCYLVAVADADRPVWLPAVNYMQVTGRRGFRTGYVVCGTYEHLLLFEDWAYFFAEIDSDGVVVALSRSSPARMYCGIAQSQF